MSHTSKGVVPFFPCPATDKKRSADYTRQRQIAFFSATRQHRRRTRCNEAPCIYTCVKTQKVTICGLCAASRTGQFSVSYFFPGESRQSTHMSFSSFVWHGGVFFACWWHLQLYGSAETVQMATFALNARARGGLR